MPLADTSRFITLTEASNIVTRWKNFCLFFTEESEADAEAEAEDDEGIGSDHIEHSEIRLSGLCKTFMEECAKHLAVESESKTHFRNVCRALVSEAVELTDFMEKVKTHQENESTSEELQELGLQDWARLWRSVLRDMRTGVKLKKQEFTKTPVEYELTPYEILMSDIRERKYKLNKIMIDGELPPRMKKDAHDIILTFIRSRPPLKPVSKNHST